jgi:hypothetical protein
MSGEGMPNGPTDANTQIKSTLGENLFVVEISVSGQDVTLELLLVGVPELGSLGVQRARTVEIISTAT